MYCTVCIIQCVLYRVCYTQCVAHLGGVFHLKAGQQGGQRGGGGGRGGGATVPRIARQDGGDRGIEYGRLCPEKEEGEI